MCPVFKPGSPAQGREWPRQLGPAQPTSGAFGLVLGAAVSVGLRQSSDFEGSVGGPGLGKMEGDGLVGHHDRYNFGLWSWEQSGRNGQFLGRVRQSEGHLSLTQGVEGEFLNHRGSLKAEQHTTALRCTRTAHTELGKSHVQVMTLGEQLDWKKTKCLWKQET